MKVQQVDIAAELEKAIFWIYLNEGGFPRKKLLEHEKASYQSQPIKEFEKALIECDGAIWILDGHFDHTHGLNALWDALCLTSAREIKIISCKKRPDEWIAERLKKNLKPEVEILWRKHRIEEFPVHDRFALLDNELWHFGSTVGGGYPGAGAATRGWGANTFKNIFRSLWER